MIVSPPRRVRGPVCSRPDTILAVHLAVSGHSRARLHVDGHGTGVELHPGGFVVTLPQLGSWLELEGGADLLSVEFAPPVLQRLTPPLAQSELALGWLMTQTGRSDLVESLCRALADDRGRCGNVSSRFAAAAAQALFCEVLRIAAAPPPTADGAQARVDRVASFVLQNLAAPCGLATLASIAGTSRHQLCRDFMRHRGISPARYVATRRVARARELLSESDLAMREIAAAVGYLDAGHFARVFRRETGMTPRQYRAAASRGVAA